MLHPTGGETLIGRKTWSALEERMEQSNGSVDGEIVCRAEEAERDGPRRGEVR
jgi:hypothetical protein